MTRHPHWETRLCAFAQDARGQPFRWGSMDCVLLAFRAIDCMLAAPPGAGWAARWAGRWHTRAQALAAAAGTTLEDELLAGGATAHAPAYAQPGDVLVLTGRRLPWASVLLGPHRLGVSPRHGVELFTLGELLARRDVLSLRVG